MASLCASPALMLLARYVSGKDTGHPFPRNHPYYAAHNTMMNNNCNTWR